MSDMELLIIAFLVLSAIFHEFMHGYVALNLGDPTAKLAGRLTLNPFAHLDLWGSFIIPASLILLKSPFMFAYAKPVPINPLYFKHRTRDTILVAIAGPLSNLFLALVFLTALKLFALYGGDENSFTAAMFYIIIYVNVLLAVFNLIPIPPLDGSKFLYYFFPNNHVFLSQLESMGFMLLIGFLLLFPGLISTIVSGSLNLLFSLFKLQEYIPLLVR